MPSISVHTRPANSVDPILWRLDIILPLPSTLRSRTTAEDGSDGRGPGRGWLALFEAHYTKTIFVVAACSSQPRVGSAVIEETSLMEIWRPRVFGPLTSTCSGSHVCWEIFWCSAGL